MEPKAAFVLDVIFAVFAGGFFFRSSYKGLKDHNVIKDDRKNFIVSSFCTTVVFLVCIYPSLSKLYDYVIVEPKENKAERESIECSKACGGEICADRYTAKYPHGTHFNEVVSAYMRASNSQECQLHGNAVAYSGESAASPQPMPAPAAVSDQPAKPFEQPAPPPPLLQNKPENLAMSQQTARKEIEELAARAIQYDGAFKCGSGRQISARVGKVLNASNINIRTDNNHLTPSERAIQASVVSMLQANSQCSVLMSGKASQFCQKRSDEEGIPNRPDDKFTGGEARLKFVKDCSIAVVSGTDDYPNWKYPK